MPLMEIRVGDIYRLRKPHPCGSYEWLVNRIGVDIGMCCQRCGHRVMLHRPEFERRVRALVARSPLPDDPPRS